VSGHAAVAFWVTAFAFLLPNPYRLPFIIGGLALGVLMGLARIVEGAHFLSDVVFAGLIVVGLNMWLARRVGLAGPGQDISHGS
jgi:lipid A 4'-phosphatase